MEHENLEDKLSDAVVIGNAHDEVRYGMEYLLFLRYASEVFRQHTSWISDWISRRTSEESHISYSRVYNGMTVTSSFCIS